METYSMKTISLLVLWVVSFAVVDAANGVSLSPAELKIQAARGAIEKSPGRPQPRTELALALARRARETSDPAYYVQAQSALEEALKIDPENFEAQKIHAWVLLGQHEFAKAAEAARKLNQRSPDDVLVYGFLADAYAELGKYDEAEKAAQWMLDLRPGNVPGLTRGAYLREIYGDVDGAIELMQKADQRTHSSEVEDRAWILTQIAHLNLMSGRVAEAEQILEQALELFPGYHYSLAQLARVRIEQGRTNEAVTLLQQRYEKAPHPENLFDLAEALEKDGKSNEAEKAFHDFEKKAIAETKIADNSNRELALYYADYGKRPAEALRIAELEASRRQDVYTLDVLAWAQFQNGKTAESKLTLDRALAVGTKDPRILKHAAAIAAKASLKT